MTFDVPAKDMTATTWVKCRVRMWNHNTMSWKGYPGRKIHSAFYVPWLKILQKLKKWNQNFTFCQIKKKNPANSKFFDWNTWVETNIFQKTVKMGIPQAKVIIKLTKMTK